MKPLHASLVAVLLVSCGGSSADISNFTGNAWSLNETITTDCGGQTVSDSETVMGRVSIQCNLRR